MLIIKIILVSVGVLILVFFANQNSSYVSIYYGSKEPVEYPLFFVVYLAFVIGMVVIWAVSLVDKLKISSQLRTLRKEKKRIEGELSSLRKMPIVESRDSIPPVEAQKKKLPEGNETSSEKGSA